MVQPERRGLFSNTSQRSPKISENYQQLIRGMIFWNEAKTCTVHNLRWNDPRISASINMIFNSQNHWKANISNKNLYILEIIFHPRAAWALIPGNPHHLPFRPGICATHLKIHITSSSGLNHLRNPSIHDKSLVIVAVIIPVYKEFKYVQYI